MSARTSTRLTNVPRGLLLRVTWLVAPALVALIGLAGVTAPPALSLRDARAMLEFQRERARQHEHESELRERYDEGALDERATRVLESIRRRVPATLDPIVAHGALRIACERVGFQLELLGEFDELDTGLAQLDDRLVLGAIELAGEARMASLPLLLRELEALGLPACVLALTVDSPDGLAHRSDVRLRLGLLHRASPLVRELEQTNPETEPQ